ncbi:MAG: hypothetical protein QNL92_11105 [Octadecabacter sp.]
MKNLIATSCAALLVIASAAPSFAETRTAPGEWRPDNAAALEQQYDCDPNEWTRAISDATGETLYSNNWTCQPGRVSEQGNHGEQCGQGNGQGNGPGDGSGSGQGNGQGGECEGEHL